MMKTKEHDMTKTSIPMASVECVGYAHFAARAADLNWNADFQPDFLDVDGVEALKYKQPGAYLFLTVTA